MQRSYGSLSITQKCSPYDKGRDNSRDVEWTQCHINLPKKHLHSHLKRLQVLEICE